MTDRVLPPLLIAIALTVSAAIPAGAASTRRLVAPVVNVQVSHDGFPAHSEPSVAENPANPLNLVAASKFFTNTKRYLFKIGTMYSTDAGATWTDSGVLPGFKAYRRVSDVSIAFSPNGSLVYACVLADKGNRSGIFVSRSRDGGRTWSAPATVFLDTSGATFSDKPWIAVDGSHGPHRGAVYVAWNLDAVKKTIDMGPAVPFMRSQGAPAGGMVVSHSTDYGRTYSTPVVIARFDRRDFAIGAMPAVGPAGRLTVAFLKLVGRLSDIVIDTSTDGGATFGPQREVDANIIALPNHLPNGTFRNFSMPAFAISPRTGTMVVAWADMRKGDADILKSRSTNGGTTWSIPARVNHDPAHNGKDQFQPALAVAPDGVFACAWFDRSLDPGNRLIDEMAAVSRNDGSTFGRRVRVTQTSWNPSIDAPEPQGKPTNTFIGDYQGLAMDDAAVHPLWNDTQNGRSQEIRTAAIPIGSF